MLRWTCEGGSPEHHRLGQTWTGQLPVIWVQPVQWDPMGPCPLSSWWFDVAAVPAWFAHVQIRSLWLKHVETKATADENSMMADGCCCCCSGDVM